ncbi:MAG TPA: metal ABC transporter ATP-binding protein [Dermatophilaceae bacterium]|nr:metal ABC transporter ATP-binding protein [Dermatophilaceae bacterium]
MTTGRWAGSPPLLEVRDGSFGYGERAVVRDISLTVHPGEVVALLGPNASGKSTLVKGVLGLAETLHGEVLLLGEPAEQLADRTRIGYVPQRHSLSTSVRATVREVVEVGRLPHRPWWRAASATDRRVVDGAIEAVGLADRAGEPVATLSGGQQRRVLIARALAGQPDLLLMDEPTAGVDLASQRVLADVLARLAAAGTSMVVVTHELATLYHVVTRVVCLDAGRVDFDGTPEEYDAQHPDHDASRGHHHDREGDRYGGRPRAAGAVVPTAPLDRPESRRG